MPNKYLVTIKGDDVFVYDCTLTATSERELLDKVAKLCENLGKTTIEQFRSITIDRL